MATITIDPNYGYVILAATSTFLLNTIHGLNASKYRKAAQVKYPAAYAPDSRTDKEAFLFNCAQRAHANYIENHVSALGLLLIAGLRFPIASAVMGAGWTVSRYLYMVGYCSGAAEGKGRLKGATQFPFLLGLLGLAVYTGISLALEW